jgi:type IV pilus assembly protein PilB
MATKSANLLEELPDAIQVEPDQGTPRQRRAVSPSERSRKLGEWLILEGLITEGQLRDALAYQSEHGGKLGEIMVRLGIVDEDEYVSFLARTAGVGSVRLYNYAIREEDVRLMPRELAARHEMVAVDRFDDQLVVAMVCPLNYQALSEVENLTGLTTRTVLCSGDAFRLAFENFYPHDGTVH